MDQLKPEKPTGCGYFFKPETEINPITYNYSNPIEPEPETFMKIKPEPEEFWTRSSSSKHERNQKNRLIQLNIHLTNDKHDFNELKDTNSKIENW